MQAIYFVGAYLDAVRQSKSESDVIEAARKAAIDCNLLEKIVGGVYIFDTINDRSIESDWVFEVFTKEFFGVAIDKYGIGLVWDAFHNMRLTSIETRVRGILEKMYKQSRDRVRRTKNKEKQEFVVQNAEWSEPGKVTIPEIGVQIRLEENWTFLLHREGRNKGLFTLIGQSLYPAGLNAERVTIKEGSILKFDRIYIRKGSERMKEFSSITFYLQGGTVEHNGKEFPCKKSVRFWVNTPDVNTIVASFNKTSF